MEKAEGEEQLPVENGLRAATELIFGHQLVQTLHVGFHALRTTGDSVCTRIYKTQYTKAFCVSELRLCAPGWQKPTVWKREGLSKSTFGGSVVILMAACRTVMGNSGWGEELSQSLKLGWGCRTCSCSTSLSSSGIQERERWQLARKTQWPGETVRRAEMS